jgi:5S rRNA maturation endonuclease (ribonuclease M5)
MPCYSTATAPERRNPTGKNRVWDFFRLSNGTRPATRCQPAQPRRKIRPTPTKTASGIPYWPSRDPIGEIGGINLYTFVMNDGANMWDLRGMYAQILMVADFTGKPEDAGTKTSIKSNLDSSNMAVGKHITKLEQMTDEDFNEAAKNGVYVYWWLDAKGKRLNEAIKTKVNADRSTLIKWLKREKESSYSDIQTAATLTSATVLDAIKAMKGDPDYKYDTMQFIAHALMDKGVRIGGMDDRIPYKTVGDAINGLQFFESKAFTSCGANDGQGSIPNLIPGGLKFDEKLCTIIFTPTQAGYEEMGPAH